MANPNTNLDAQTNLVKFVLGALSSSGRAPHLQ